MRRYLRLAIAVASALAAAFLTACGRSSGSAETTATAVPTARVAFFLPSPDGAALVRREVVPAPGEEPLAASIRALANAPGSPMPPGTVVRSAVVRDDVAEVSLSRPFVAGYPSGAAGETALIGALVATATAQTGVTAVRILVDGAAPDVPGAQLDLGAALRREDVPLPILDER